MGRTVDISKAPDEFINYVEEKYHKYMNLANSSNFDGYANEEKEYLAKAEMCEELLDDIDRIIEKHAVTVSNDIRALDSLHRKILDDNKFGAKVSEKEVMALVHSKQYLSNSANDITFSAEELEQIKYAVEHLHDSDLSSYGNSNVEALESVMDKLEIQYVSQLDDVERE